eukprot:63193-Pyramimonas_sp.AAC.1
MRATDPEGCPPESSSPMLLAFDYGQAFPSLNHSWMWRALDAWRAPVGFLEALQGIYVSATTFSACSARVP